MIEWKEAEKEQKRMQSENKVREDRLRDEQERKRKR